MNINGKEGYSCKQCRNKATLFTLQDGRVVYACTKHASTIRTDHLVDWFRIGTLKREP